MMSHNIFISKSNTKPKFSKFKVTIENIDFEITGINEEFHQVPIYQGNQYRSIRINAKISNQDYMALGNWIEKSIGKSINYKRDIYYNTIQIHGVFPTDYTFNQYDIDVTLSADYIVGNMELFYLQKLRKEKLEKIMKNSNEK
jgi:hypothetical protein